MHSAAEDWYRCRFCAWYALAGGGGEEHAWRRMELRRLNPDHRDAP